LSVSVPFSCCFFYYDSVVKFKVRYVIPPVLLFLLRIAFAIWGFLCFHINYKIGFSTSVKNSFGILMGIALNLQLALVVQPFS
jgi:hypothetical protein